MALLLAAVIQPQLTVAQSPPAIMVMPRNATPGRRIANIQPQFSPPVRLDIIVAASGRELYRGSLRAARNASANYSQSWSQAPLQPCQDGQSYGGSEQHALNLTLYSIGWSERSPAVNLSVSWKRPTATNACGDRSSRTVQLTETEPIAEGATTVVEGDAGLRVTITPRDAAPNP